MRISGSHFRSCATLPCTMATFSGGPAGCAQSMRANRAPLPHDTTATASIAKARRARLTSVQARAPATNATRAPAPCTPSTGSHPDAGPSICAYPTWSHGNPVNAQPRSHSHSVHAAGYTASNRGRRRPVRPAPRSSRARPDRARGTPRTPPSGPGPGPRERCRTGSSRRSRSSRHRRHRRRTATRGGRRGAAWRNAATRETVRRVIRTRWGTVRTARTRAPGRRPPRHRSHRRRSDESGSAARAPARGAVIQHARPARSRNPRSAGAVTRHLQPD